VLLISYFPAQKWSYTCRWTLPASTLGDSRIGWTKGRSFLLAETKTRATIYAKGVHDIQSGRTLAIKKLEERFEKHS
jgi:hypothetical protein